MIQVRHMVNVDHGGLLVEQLLSEFIKYSRIQVIFVWGVWGSSKITQVLLSCCLFRKFLQILQNIAPRCLLEFLQTSYFALSVHFCTISGHDSERWGGI